MRKKRVVILVMWRPSSEVGRAGLCALASTGGALGRGDSNTRASSYAALALCKTHFTRPVGRGEPLTFWQVRKLGHRQVTCSRSHGLEMAGFELR